MIRKTKNKTAQAIAVNLVSPRRVSLLGLGVVMFGLSVLAYLVLTNSFAAGSLPRAATDAGGYGQVLSSAGHLAVTPNSGQFYDATQVDGSAGPAWPADKIAAVSFLVALIVFGGLALVVRWWSRQRVY